MFKGLYPHLDFQLFWLIRKSEDGDGFLSCHKDLINFAKTDVTIVVNHGSYLDRDANDTDSIGSSTYSNAVGLDKENALCPKRFHSLG